MVTAMDEVDAEGAGIGCAGQGAHTEHSGNSATAIRLGDVHRTVCVQLSFVFLADMAAVFSGERTSFLDAGNGAHRRNCISASGAFGAPLGMVQRFVAGAGHQPDAGTEDVYGDGFGD